MSNPFFDRPILSSPYAPPAKHWELDPEGQPTQRVIESRRLAQFITPIPRPQKQKAQQQTLGLDEGKGLSSDKQQYAQTSLINDLRVQVDKWRRSPHPNDWQVTPETARLLQHWRHYAFNGVRPFFC